MQSKSIYSISMQEWREYLSSIDEPQYRAEQIFKSLHSGVSLSEISTISKPLKARIESDFYVDLPRVVKTVVSRDGTKKYLLDIDGEGTHIECVYLPQDYGNTICISTQVGCKMGCAFCASCKNGFIRNLESGEMLAQVLLVEKLNKGRNGEDKDNAKSRHLTNIVVMGSGEPFDNYNNTIDFLHLVTDSHGINIGARGISVSTSGIVPKIREFAREKLQVNLCISLHAPNDEIRTKIMPVAKAYKLADLIDAAKYFFKQTKRRVIFEYVLIEGVNCEIEHARELSTLIRGFPAHINLINLNRHELSDLQPPSREKAMRFMDTLIKCGTSTTMRKSRGADIESACGQLRTKYVGEMNTVFSDKKG